MFDASRFQETEQLKDGKPIVIRAVRPDDKQMLSEAFFELERESRYARYFGFKDSLSEEDLVRGTELDFVNEVALVVTTRQDGREIAIGGGRYVLTGAEPPRAEFACVVEEDFQGHGLAGRLLGHLAAIARAQGLVALEAIVQPANHAMLRVFERSGLPIQSRYVEGLLELTLALD